MKFLKISTLEEARQKLFEQMSSYILSSESVALEFSLNRVLAEDLSATENIPDFRRSTVDGYALISKDTQGAGESIPSFLSLLGSVEMGKPANFTVTSGTTCEVPTGAMLPAGADAVVMLEYCESLGDDIAVYKSVAYGENTIDIGDDVKKSALLPVKNKFLQPKDLGVLAAAGYFTVKVYTRPKISIISTGDELVSPGKPLEPGKIRDINSFSLAAAAQESGFSVADTNVLPDDEEILTKSILQAMETSQIVVISGGSSAGKKDLTAKIIENVASEGIHTRGLAIKPGKPTILGYDVPTQTVLAGLPGHPISAMVVFELLLGQVYRELLGAAPKMPIPGRLSRNVPASPGKLTFYPCKLTWENDNYSVTPVLYKSGLITGISQADGYFLIEKDREGLNVGERVLVTLI